MPLVSCNDKGGTVVHKAAFRCKNCGQLVRGEHAGENLLPHACPVCKAGVTLAIDPSAKARFDEIVKELGDINTAPQRRDVLARELADLPREKLYHEDNWEVLADCDGKRLKELGLKPEHVGKYEPKVITKPRQGRVVRAEAADGPAVSDGAKGKVG
jgi:predicted RNA-binding Zn-ribbon protein involved in translation (DUF1610 family)